MDTAMDAQLLTQSRGAGLWKGQRAVVFPGGIVGARYQRVRGSKIKVVPEIE